MMTTAIFQVQGVSLMKVYKIAFIFFMLTFIVTCGLFEKKTTIRIEGVVTDANDGSLIINSTVKLITSERTGGGIGGPAIVAAEARTGQNGGYSLKYVEKGYCSETFFTIEAGADGYFYQIFHSYDETHVRCTDDLQTINFQLQPGSPFQSEKLFQ